MLTEDVIDNVYNDHDNSVHDDDLWLMMMMMLIMIYDDEDEDEQMCT